jgi:hypothetical protein
MTKRVGRLVDVVVLRRKYGVWQLDGVPDVREGFMHDECWTDPGRNQVESLLVLYNIDIGKGNVIPTRLGLDRSAQVPRA